MLKKRLLILLSGFGMLLVGGPASALGFRSSSPSAALGQPLDFVVTMRIEPGELLEPECVRAEVTLGERELPSAAIRVQVERDAAGQPLIRVRTLGRVDEPVVAVQVSAGCTSRMARRFVVFADPPLAMPVEPAAIVALVAAAPPTEAVVAAPPTRVAADAPAAATASAPAPRPARRARRERRAEAPPAIAAAPALPANVEPAPPPLKPRRERPAAPPPAPVARLTLDPLPAAPSGGAPLNEQALALVEEANTAVLAAIAAASASQSRLQALEASVEQLRREAQEQAALTAQLRERASAAERRTAWVLPLWAAVLLLIGLAAWLWLRLRDAERLRQQAWRQAAAEHPAPTPTPVGPPSKVPVLDERSIRSGRAVAAGGGLAPPATPRASEMFDDPPEPELGPEPPMQRTQPLPPSVPAPAAPPVAPKGVSAEELIDLEQQAEFFVVLGQEEAAIDLLVGHLRETGGTSPLPYLKLLEIYRRRGDAEAYERTRSRFNHRFNAHAPEWDAPPGQGRTLSGYPAVLHWIERVWPTPVDAMAELEVLLFRRDGGELFDLPAYRELLFLYALARDLMHHPDDGGTAVEPVDVLLPIGGQGEAGEARPVGSEHLGDMATTPVDLDLSEPGESRFGPTR